MKTIPEQRQYPRRSAIFSVKYTVKTGTYRDLVRNVSAGGINIATRRTIKHGARINLQFPAFAFDRKPSVMGTVVRSQDRWFAVKFDNPIEERICPDDHYPGIEIDQDGSS